MDHLWDVGGAKHLSELQLSELKPPINITWKRGKDMPFMMSYYPDIAVLKEIVYVGGGGLPIVNMGTETHTVMMYDIQRDNWKMLPPYSFYWFSLTVLNDQLVLVGGVDEDDERTNKLGVLDDKAQWTHPFPPMPTARSGATVVTHSNRWLVAAGGYNEFCDSGSEVEIFDLSVRQWYRGTSLPIEGYKMSSTIIKNTWYILGGFTYETTDREVLCVNLNDLIIQAISQRPTSSPSTEWYILPSTPLVRSTALALNGALLAVGGELEGSAVCLYEPRCRRWNKVEELLSEREQCACTVLPCGKVFIVGGATEQVHIGTLEKL